FLLVDDQSSDGLGLLVRRVEGVAAPPATDVTAQVRHADRHGVPQRGRHADREGEVAGDEVGLLRGGGEGEGQFRWPTKPKAWWRDSLAQTRAPGRYPA